MNFIKIIRIIILGIMLFLIQCSGAENAFKNFIPTDNSPAAPKVIASLPAPGQTGVPKDQKIIITFNKEVDKQSCIAAFTMQPPATGLFDVTGNVMTFTPSRQFSGAITYVANLSNRCEDKNGRDLEQSYNIDFSVSTDVQQPTILSFQAKKNSQGCSAASPYVDVVNFKNNVYSTTDVCPNSSILINFSKPMDRGTVESNFLTVPQLIGAFVWSGNNTVLEFTPNELLATGITYIITVSNQAQDLSDNPLPKSYTASFTVGSEILKPQIAMQDGYVRNGLGCNPGTLASTLYPTGLRNAVGICSSIVQGYQNSPVIIDFTESLDLTSADSLVTISPNINGVKSWATSAHPLCGSTGSCGAGSRLTFTPIEPWQHSVTYTVTFSSNLKDLAGNLLGTNYSFSFTIGSDFQIPRITMQDGFINTGFGCTPGTLSSTIDPVNGLRNKTGGCTGASVGSLNTPIYIHFSEDMDRVSVENGFFINPNVNGVKTWSASALPLCGTTGPCGTSSLLTFTPTLDWQNTTYTVSLGNSALDSDGNTIGTSYSFSFTVGTDLIPPKLDYATGPLLGDLAPACGALGTTVIPSMSTGVCHLFSGSRIRLRFDEAMDQSKTTNAFSITPSVNGVVSWPTATELLFTPSQNMSLFTQYRVSLNSTAADIAGNRLASDFISYFTTGDGGAGNNFPPTVADVLTDTQGGPAGCNAGMDDSISASFITNVCTDNSGLGNGAAFQVVFSKNMEQSLTAQAFSISPSVSGVITWISPTIMRFVATQSLNPNAQYIVTIGGGATDSNGNRIESSYVKYFMSSSIGGYLALNSIDLSTGTVANCLLGSGSITNILAAVVNNACTGNPFVNPILLTFSQPINQSSLVNGFSISPSVSGYFSFPTAYQALFNPDALLQYGKRYTITIPTSITNTSGRGMANTIYSSFVVGALDSNFPSIVGVDFEVNGDGDGCGVVPNDFVNQPSGSVLSQVCAGTPIVVHFSEPMDTNSAMNAVSFSPFANVNYSFTGNDMTITPLTTFASGEDFSFTISTGARDLAGNALQSSFTLGFKTENTSPRVVAIGVASQTNCSSYTGNLYAGNPAGGNSSMTQCYWSDGLQMLSPAAYSLTTTTAPACPSNSLTDDIRIVFNQAMDPVATINAISMSYISNSGGSGIKKNSWQWSDSFHVVTIQVTDVSLCGNDLQAITNVTLPNYPFYLVQVDQTAKNASGTSLSSAFNFILEGN
ncbi:hypothetical protein LPTSP3_g07550 [Leptospira kobayashii]|uniref:SbsA Ig-like domain-containing protein n=1 Tax=Leptospira kobayashii TaxID=1917830 RepID=A0ABN6KA70_9LEPT|nr:Ig-like domain-containing protein [Leptospira kobayashii]BDA77825.1 hypothetical protein LPTSP3_g07550 [Leptospira kobayashii]